MSFGYFLRSLENYYSQKVVDRFLKNRFQWKDRSFSVRLHIPLVSIRLSSRSAAFEKFCEGMCEPFFEDFFFILRKLPCQIMRS